MKKYLIAAILALIVWITILTLLYEKEQTERHRLSENQTSLLGDVAFYRTRDSLSAASVGRLSLTHGEYESHFADQAELIRSLELKLKRVQSVTTTATRTETPIHTRVRDSIVVRDSLVWIQCMELHTPHLDLSGCIEDHVFTGRIIHRDTLTHVVHRIPKKWWFFRWGTKAIRMEVVSSNPNTQLVYNKYIELK